MSRIIMLMGVWLAIPFAAYFWGEAHIGKGAGIVVELGAFVAMLFFVLWDPWASSWKLALVDGLLIWCRVVMVLAGVKTAVWFFGVGPFSSSLFMAASWAIRGVVAFGISKAIHWWLSRDSDGLAID